MSLFRASEEGMLVNVFMQSVGSQFEDVFEHGDARLSNFVAQAQARSALVDDGHNNRDETNAEEYDEAEGLYGSEGMFPVEIEEDENGIDDDEEEADDGDGTLYGTIEEGQKSQTELLTAQLDFQRAFIDWRDGKNDGGLSVVEKTFREAGKQQQKGRAAKAAEVLKCSQQEPTSTSSVVAPISPLAVRASSSSSSSSSSSTSFELPHDGSPLVHPTESTHTMEAAAAAVVATAATSSSSCARCSALSYSVQAIAESVASAAATAVVNAMAGLSSPPVIANHQTEGEADDEEEMMGADLAHQVASLPERERHIAKLCFLAGKKSFTVAARKP